MDRDKDDIEKLVEGAMHLYEKYKEMNKGRKIKDKEIHTQLIKDENEIYIEADIGKDIDNIEIGKEENEVMLNVGDEKFTYTIIEELNMDEIEAVCNNGVLEVIIPKKKNVDVNIKGGDDNGSTE